MGVGAPPETRCKRSGPSHRTAAPSALSCRTPPSSFASGKAEPKDRVQLKAQVPNVLNSPSDGTFDSPASQHQRSVTVNLFLSYTGEEACGAAHPPASAFLGCVQPEHSCSIHKANLEPCEGDVGLCSGWPVGAGKDVLEWLITVGGAPPPPPPPPPRPK